MDSTTINDTFVYITVPNTISSDEDNYGKIILIIIVILLVVGFTGVLIIFKSKKFTKK